MKKINLPTLALAGTMLLTLAACSPKEPQTTPETTDPTPSMNVVSPDPAPTESMSVVTPDPAPTESVNVIAPPAETDAVVKPLETAGPATSQPVIIPDPTPEATPAPAALTAADVYSKVSAVCGGNPMSDMGFVLEEFYNLSVDDLEDFVFYMPDMSATNEEIFIAKAKSGKLDTVKTACQSRHQGFKEEAGMYPAAAAYVENAKIIVNGDWIMFCLCEKPDSAEKAFNDCTK